DRKKSVLLHGALELLQASPSLDAGAALKSLQELPSQFLHDAHINISRWTVIVSDTTLIRIGARNKRMYNSAQKNIASKLQGVGAATRSLIMNGAEAITDRGLNAIADNVPTLEVLEMAHAHRITDIGLRVLAAHCPLLTRLNISGCTRIRGAGLGALGDHCRRLTDLSIADCPHINEWVLLRCFYGFTLLEHLNLSRCDQVTDTLLKTLANQCPQIRTLLLGECTLVSDSGIVYVAQKCHQLEKIALNRSVSSERVTDTACVALGEHCPKLRDVNLSGCNFLTDAGIKWIADGCPELQVLDVSSVFHLTDASMRALSEACPVLKQLRIPNVKNVSDVGLRFLATGCSKLESLQCSNLYLVSDGSNRDFGLEGLQAIAKGCKQLRELNLTGCFQVVERALVALGASCRCKHLMSLNLGGVLQCNNAMLQAIATHCHELRELYLMQCDKISDTGLKHLATRADQFEVLDFTGCVLISDVGMAYLLDAFQQPKLVHLHLVGCALISQDTVARLAFICPLLLTLSVHGCRVSARVLQSLSSSWPFAVLRVPLSAAAVGAVEMGFFPMARAKDRRFVEETCQIWVAAVKIQNLYRTRKARQHASIRKEEATRVYVARRIQAIWRGRQARRVAMIKRIMQSGREKSATKIQRRFRENRRSRKAQQQVQVILEKQLERYAVFVQRRYRARRAASIASAIVQSRRKQHAKEVAAARAIQRRYRGIAGRKKFELTRIQKQLREKEQLEASVRIQTIYRGRADRKKAREMERQRQLEIEMRHRRATQIQAQVRRRAAWKEAERRREFIRQQERAAIRLQSVFRARKARQQMRILQMAQYHGECQRAARVIQKRWRTRKDRIGLAILVEVRKQRFIRQTAAATVVQQAFRRFLIRRLARLVMTELYRLKRDEMDIEKWAVTLMQAHWRRRAAQRVFAKMQHDSRTRWKQLIDTYNEHGRGYGAPFYYNQVNQEIRWRMPRELLTLEPRPRCDQCEAPKSASFECATCGEYFCDECNEIVHGHGKRQMHTKRKLYDYYDVRFDYGDGEFPSVWPSEIDQDRVRGYDFVQLIPKDNYQEMLWAISQYVPVVTGVWETPPPAAPNGVVSSAAYSIAPAQPLPTSVTVTAWPSSTTTTSESVASESSSGSQLFHEEEVDADGNSLWIQFFDYGRQEYRYYHRLTKRVVD
ncbi:TPA: hypothetical protein N0F65_004791, partial [Lagenidium giganteum]